MGIKLNTKKHATAVKLISNLFNVLLCYSFYRYEQCSWGWNESKKTEELYDEAAKYLIAKSSIDGSYLGFTHFRFDLEEGIEVLYWYVIFLISHYIVLPI